MLNDLAAELARLYPDPDSAKRVAGDASIPIPFLDFTGTAIDMWSGIVRQADRRQLLPNLLAVAVREYGNNAKLQRIYGTFLYGQPDARKVPGDDGGLMSRDQAPWNDQFERTKLYERVAVLERNLRYLEEAIASLTQGQASNRAYYEKAAAEIKDEIGGMRKEITDLKIAIAARPELSQEPNSTRAWIIGIGAGMAIIIVLLLLLWVRLGMPTG